MESLAPGRDEELRKALVFIDEAIRNNLGAATTKIWLDSKCGQVDIPEGSWKE
jgi:hypothetical protein